MVGWWGVLHLKWRPSRRGALAHIAALPVITSDTQRGGGVCVWGGGHLCAAIFQLMVVCAAVSSVFGVRCALTAHTHTVLPALRRC